MRQVQRQRHVVVGFVGGVTEHHALVPGTLVHRVQFGSTVNTTVDVGRLLVDGRKHTAGISFEHVLAFGIAYAVDDFTGNILQVHVGTGFYFAGQNYLTS